jgi:tetratricopeptide (TPR) repeat protein
LETAVRFDPRFAAAYARLADAYASTGYFGYPGALGGTQAFQRAEAALATALALDQSLAETQLSLAKLRWMHAPDLQVAERAIHAAIAANPVMAEAHFEHARLLAMRLRADSAASEVAAARQFDAQSSVRYADVAWVYWIVRRYDDAITEARVAIGVDSTSSTAYLALGGSLVAQGKYSEAISALEKGFALSRGNRLFLPQLGYAYALSGRTGNATRVLGDLQKLYDTGLVSPYYVAQVHVGLDQPDSALTWLEKARAERFGHLVFLRANAVWDPLRNNPRFRQLEASVGLK